MYYVDTKYYMDNHFKICLTKKILYMMEKHLLYVENI